MAKVVVRKGVTAANTGFFGYELGSFFNEPAPQIVYNTTIIKSEQNKDENNAHYYFVIAFLIVIVLLVCLGWALKIVVKVKTNKGISEIELRPVQSSNENQVTI